MLTDKKPKVDFTDTRHAFEAKSDAELRRTYRLYQVIDSPFLTKVGPPILKFALRTGLPVTGLVRRTLFDLFVGGTSLQDSVKTTEYLDQFNVKTILDFSVEGEKTEKGFESTKNEILATLRHGAKHDAVVFTACKMTGLVRFGLMEKVQSGNPLSNKEQKELEKARSRMDEIGRTAAETGTPIFIDAEETWVQDFIDQTAEELMEKYNRDRPIVHTTAQLYRVDRLAYIKDLIQRSREKGYFLGIKLVRGAYLDKERDRADEMGYPDPMQPDKASTDRDYNAALGVCIENIEHVTVTNATHNDQSSALLTELMTDNGLAPSDKRVWFSQLLGMSDHISFNLAHAGYNVAKYLPYGPVKSVMPYLIRRAQENTAVAGQSSREVELLRREIHRRKKANA